MIASTKAVLIGIIYGFAAIASAQTCQVIGQMVSCQPSGPNQHRLGGGYTAQQSGPFTYYNYNNPRAAARQGLPQSSQQIGQVRYYDNGVVRQSIGDFDYYSNGITKQSIGNFDYYSNGKTCQHIGSNTYCN
jgi:hypothetical protein